MYTNKLRTNNHNSTPFKNISLGYIMRGRWRSVALLTIVAFGCLCDAAKQQSRRPANAANTVDAANEANSGNFDGSECAPSVLLLSHYQQVGYLKDLPPQLSPSIDNNLEVCLPPGANSASCCSNATENLLKAAAAEELKNTVFLHTHSMAELLQQHQNIAYDYYRSLVESFNYRLEKYLAFELGVATEQLTDANLGRSLSKLNRSMQIYLTQPITDKQAEQLLTGHLRLTLDSIYDNLFASLLLKSATKESPLYNCTTSVRSKLQNQQMHDLVRRLNLLFLKTFAPIRTLVQALHTFVDVLDRVRALPVEDQCSKALARLSFCRICKPDAGSQSESAVNGIHHHSNTIHMFKKNNGTDDQEVYPCDGFCRNVIGGCLAHVIDMAYNWNQLVATTTQLYAIVVHNQAQVYSLQNNFYQIIVHVQNNIQEYQRKIQEECRAESSSLRSDSSFRVPEADSSSVGRDAFEPLRLDEYFRRLSEAKWVLRTLPTALCSSNNDAKKCWNGTYFAPYNRIVPNLHIGNQIFRNPEMNIGQQASIELIKDRLDIINTKVQSRLLLPRHRNHVASSGLSRDDTNWEDGITNFREYSGGGDDDDDDDDDDDVIDVDDGGGDDDDANDDDDDIYEDYSGNTDGEVIIIGEGGVGVNRGPEILATTSEDFIFTHEPTTTTTTTTTTIDMVYSTAKPIIRHHASTKSIFIKQQIPSQSAAIYSSYTFVFVVNFNLFLTYIHRSYSYL